MIELLVGLHNMQLSSLLKLSFIAIVVNATTGVVVALAVASIGGIFSSTATDMGTQVSS